ncbi:hypothetical protein CK203_023050 [Vitis vinifera]|uniref:Uncharacterized protein n=1 Tax=Vitis vinifera TaxID=29760 RepID=A0A438J4B6_VITVI|nr:hypothetical protein CK203_023050 [Vitis vinifera]
MYKVDSDQTRMEEESDFLVLASDLIRIIESSILTFHLFLKMDKKKSSGVLNLFGGQNQTATPLQQIQSFLEKVRHLIHVHPGKSHGSLPETERDETEGAAQKAERPEKEIWPATHAEVEMLFGLIDIKVLSRVLRMERITKEQLLWCEGKMNKLELLDGKLQRTLLLPFSLVNIVRKHEQTKIFQVGSCRKTVFTSKYSKAVDPFKWVENLPVSTSMRKSAD